MLALALLPGCPTAIGVREVGASSVHKHLTRNVLSAGKPSAPSRQVLHRLDLYDRFKSEPAVVLAELRERLPLQGDEDEVFALAELSYLHADKGGGRPYYLAAALYAYAFLFPGGDGAPPERLDPRLRLAADLYNRGLTKGLKGPDSFDLDLRPGGRELPFGSLDLEVDEASLKWGSYRMTQFFPVAELEVEGLRNRYRRPGIGAPLAAGLVTEGDGRAPRSFRRVPSDVKVAVTAFLRLKRPRQQLARSALRGQLELYTSESVTSIQAGGRRLPLEYESSSSLALSLSEPSFSGFDMAGFFSGGEILKADEGLLMLSPYRRGKIPVVLVHGTASSPGWWGNLLNELQNDPELRDRFQFWLYRYASSSELDPSGSDPALHNMVVIGHSQGGLLAKLTVVDSGDVFWAAYSDRPFDSYHFDPDTQTILERSLFVEPVRSVRRVIFMATPHGGSYLAKTGLANLLLRVVTLPVDLATIPMQLVETDEKRLADALASPSTSIHGMTPGSELLETLASLPVADGVATHSIIGVLGNGSIEKGDDGVVKYRSAHIEGVESELVVRSSHSVQLNPLAIGEVDRILREHIGAD
jgi:pimeloyl-ACP methyl ester carboxylesterase